MVGVVIGCCRQYYELKEIDNFLKKQERDANPPQPQERRTANGSGILDVSGTKIRSVNADGCVYCPDRGYGAQGAGEVRPRIDG